MLKLYISDCRLNRHIYNGAIGEVHPHSMQKIFSIAVLASYYEKNKLIREESEYFYNEDDTD